MPGICALVLQRIAIRTYRARHACTYDHYTRRAHSARTYLNGTICTHGGSTCYACAYNHGWIRRAFTSGDRSI